MRTPSRIILLGWIATACGCGGSTVQPTPPDPIVVSCPADIEVVSHNGQAPTVTFETPATSGAPPVTVVCTPASGSQFQNGPTMVTCEATDTRIRKASCSFFVVVTPIPRLEKTRFLAFGDSLTEGKISPIRPGIVVVPPGTFNTSASYVEQLSAKLSARYQDQTITVIADGWGGEQTGEGKNRLKGHLPLFNPEVLLLMEGTNDMLFTPDGPGIQSAIDALQDMVRQGKSQGTRVFLATILPIDPARRGAATAAGVNTLNGRIRQLADTEKVTLVDLNAVVPLSLIGSDGLHPKPQAYDLMADEWLQEIKTALEVNTTTSP